MRKRAVRQREGSSPINTRYYLSYRNPAFARQDKRAVPSPCIMTVTPMGMSIAEAFLCARDVLQGSPAPSCTDWQGRVQVLLHTGPWTWMETHGWAPEGKVGREQQPGLDSHGFTCAIQSCWLHMQQSHLPTGIFTVVKTAPAPGLESPGRDHS